MRASQKVNIKKKDIIFTCKMLTGLCERNMNTHSQKDVIKKKKEGNYIFNAQIFKKKSIHK
jgi:hypothetical protein